MKKAAFLVSFVMIVAAVAGLATADPLDPSDAQNDMDRDGLETLDEYTIGSDPTDPDSDGAGCYDGWEYYFETHRATDKGGVVYISDNYHFSPVNADDEGIVTNMYQLIQVRDGDANVLVNDPDNDGWNNYHEFLVGSDPTNPNTDGDSFRTDSTDPDPLVSNDDHPGGDPNNCEGPDCPDNPCPDCPDHPNPNPDNPTNPDNPSNPDNPTNPDDPTNPDPDSPDDPENPSNPDNPDSPKLRTRIVLDNEPPYQVSKGEAFQLRGYVQYWNEAAGVWRNIDAKMGVDIFVNFTSGHSIKVGNGWADQTGTLGYGYFSITNVVPGSAPSGYGIVSLHALGNEFFAQSWLEVY
jgi:hypothetical protein